MIEAEPAAILPLILAGLMAVGYCVLALRQRARPQGWSGWRTGAFLAGCCALALGLLPRLLPYPTGDFRKHMLQHLILGMIAPLGLVLSAPMTLLLRTVCTQHGRALSHLLQSRALQVVANPLSALALNFGGMAALYFTPLYGAMHRHQALHAIVHIHFLAAGCLYTWVIAGPDPAPHRPSVPTRLLVLGVAVVLHSVLSQLLYADLFVQVSAPAAQLHGGAEWMYYGGDLSEMLLAFALVTTWHPARRPTRRDPQASPPAKCLTV
ncbi:MAG TPA: cytochrome c oxidase assembly protein [Acidobacteriaceae bacterium]